MSDKKPSKDAKGPYAALIHGVWTAYPTAFAARTEAWAQPERPPVWRIGPTGWTQLAPGRPHQSGGPGGVCSNPEVRFRATSEQIARWTTEAQQVGLSLQDWIRRQLLRAR